MSESQNKNRRPLYPKAKTFDEIYAAKKQREIENRPRFVATKISTWSTLAIVVALIIYQLLTVLTDNLALLPSTGEVLFMVSTLIFVGFIAVMTWRFLFLRIRDIVGSVLPSPRPLFVVLILVFVISLIGLIMLPYFGQANLLVATAVLVFNFVVSWVSVKGMS